jgi:hypothetical protein
MKTDIYNFLNDLISEFEQESTISVDTFNRAISLRNNFISDSDMHCPKCNSDNIQPKDFTQECISCWHIF